MPRNPNAGPSTHRNRNRVTNKTRLKVIQGNIDADPLVLDEDEEKARVVSTAGVDAEDANEHHLQAVLSAAAQRHQANARSTRTSVAEKDKAPAAYIPTPDSTGLVDNYDQLYPPGLWKDPATQLRWSSTVEESTTNALNGGFAYYMDEYDKEWLDKNNEEARGEGTSAQGAVSAGTTTRSGQSQRSSKAKGKEPEVTLPMAMSEDEFELVMAIFEKVTHDKTEYLHHALEQGMPFPAFSEYQDTFASPLPPSIFSNFTAPAWLPSPSHLLRLARFVYPHWRERRIECEGKRIIPAVNLDETDTKNESYICFRRREIKAVRKTRASQVTFSDKLSRLQSEFTTALDIAGELVTREVMKKEVLQQTQQVWDHRFAFSDLKRKFPSLSTKEDDDLLVDKERPPKRTKQESRMSLKIRTVDSAAQMEPLIRPKERAAAIALQIERELARVKDRDHGCWDDQVENSYQPKPVPLAQRYFRLIPQSVSVSPGDGPHTRAAVAMRRRAGRGGRMHYDRRILLPRTARPLSPKPTDDYVNRVSDRGPIITSDVDNEFARRVSERWRYDQDDSPPVVPEGAEELDRALIDDYDPKYMRHSMTLLHDQDHLALMTDPTLPMTAPDGKQLTVTPFRLGPQPIARRDIPSSAAPRLPIAVGVQGQAQIPLAINPSMPAGTPISMQAQLKKMQPPAVPQMRIPSNGAMRPPAPPNLPTMPTTHASSPQPSSVLVNGHASDSNVNGDFVESNPSKLNSSEPAPEQSHAIHVDGQSTVPSESVVSIQSTSPTRPSSQSQQHAAITIPVMSNGFHISSVNGFSVGNNSSGMTFSNSTGNGLSQQQMQTIKSAFAGIPTMHDMSAIQANGGNMVPRVPAAYVGHIVPNNVNYEMQLRQMQWNSAQRLSSGGINGSMSPASNAAYSPPIQPGIAAVNGIRGNGMSVSHVIGQGQHSHLQPHSSSPLLQSPSPVPNVPPHSSPPITSSQPPMASPSRQTQQPVGASNGRYT